MKTNASVYRDLPPQEETPIDATGNIPNKLEQTQTVERDETD